MGNKSGRSGNHILYYIAVSSVIVAVNLAACTPVQDKVTAARAHKQLQQYREDLAQGFFEPVIEQSMQVIAQNETEFPADLALYALGEAYAHHDYQHRDYFLSKYYFEKLIKNFPDSDLSSEAKTYISLFETMNLREEVAESKESKSVSDTTNFNLVEDDDYQGAVQRNLLILEEVGINKPADEALYNLGLIYAHVNNQAKDYKKSQSYFHILTEHFPNSEFTEEAIVILGLFEVIKKIQQIDIDIERQRKQLTR